MTDIETIDGWTICNRCVEILAKDEPDEVVNDIITAHERDKHLENAEHAPERIS